MKCIRAGLSLVLAIAHCAAALAAPEILSPPDGSTLSGSSETFTWSADGSAIDRWRLEVGTVPDGRDLYGQSLASTVTSILVSGLPTDGSPVYVNLKWRTDGVVSAVSYVYTAMDDSVPPPNVAPAVDAGADQAIALPVDSITLNGVVSDDGLPLGTLNLNWSMLSGPGTVSFLDSTMASTTATFVTPGDYVLQLNASDTLLDTSDQLSVTVYASAVLTTIQVTPDPAVLLIGETQQFVASGLDQIGQPYAIAPDWSATGGSMDTGGFYTAGAITGQFQATASAESVVGLADIFIVEDLGPWPTNGWEIAIPADMEMEQTLLEQARDYALTGDGSGMITRHGREVLSWGNTTSTIDVKSVTKSVGALMLGLAIKDNLVALTDLAQTHYPAVGANPASNVDTGWLEEITIGHLVTQTGGFGKSSGYVDILFQPGTTWAYSDGGVNWLGDTLTVAYQGDLLPILQSRILTPLGIPTAQLDWTDSTHRDLLVEGYPRREFNSSVFTSADAMARLGYLVLRNGHWDGQNIVPPTFIDQMRTTVPGVVGLPVANDLDSKYSGASGHYGLSWWNNADDSLPNVPTDAYWAWGINDHLILVIPSLDIVASRRGGTAWAGSRTPSYYQVLGPFFDPIIQSVAVFGNQAPTVDAGVDTSITLPTDTVNLDGTVSDDDLPYGTLDISWSFVSGPGAVTFANGLLEDTAATFTVAGDYILRLTATDGYASVSDDVLVTMLTEPDTELPIVTVTAPADGATVSGSVTLTATATDNNSVTEVEFFAAGSSIGIDTIAPYAATWNSTLEIDGDYDITAVGRDPSGNEGGDSIMVTLDNAAANAPPTVDAGASAGITLPTDTVSLNGTASDDGLPGGTLTTTWSAISPPFAVTFLDATALATDATFGGSGTYVLRLTADDGALSASADVTITVNPELASEQTFVAIGDNIIHGSQPSRTIGGGVNIEVHSFGPKVGLVQFDLSTLSGATISSASFRFRLNRLKADGNIDLQLLDEAWSEATVTYDNQPAFGATVLSVPVTAIDVGTVISVDVTGIVQSWADGSQPSHGFRLATVQGINASIDSRESTGTPMELLVTVGTGTPTVEMPTITPNGATSTTPVEVTLATATPGASIYYTLDGSTPTTGSNFYSVPFTLSASATVKARAFASGFADSVVNTAVFDIDTLTGGGLNNYWPLNEIAAGSYANDGGGTVGACSSCPTPAVGLIDGGQSFDGTSNVITVADDGSADWTQNGGFSVEFWVNKSMACSAREVVVGRFDSGTAMQWAVGCDSGFPFFELADTNGTSVTITGTGAIDDGEWHHVVAVYDGFFEENRLYIDGILEASGAAAYTAGFGSSADVTIGELQNGLDDTFLQGLVDEVAFHDRSIPMSMINRHYQDGAIGLRDGYVGCSSIVDVMPLGDSITNRLGYRSTLYFDLTGPGYDVNFVGSNSDGTGTHDRDHEGWSGFATIDIAANLNGWLSGNPPQVILLHIGTNDIGSVSVAEAITGLTSVLDIIHAFDPEITVVLGQIINQQTFSQGVVDYNDQMATLAQTKLAAGHKILLVDHENALIYPDDMSDLEHPNDAGFAKMAGVWFNGMTNFLPPCNLAAPTFKSFAGTSGQVANEYRYQPSVLANPDGRFSSLTAPAGLQVHPDTGEIRWTPGSAGQYQVDLQVQNSAGSAVQSFILNVP